MVNSLCASAGLEAVARVSRRTMLHRVGGVATAAVVGTVAPTRVQAQDAPPTLDLEANKVLARRFHDEIFEQGSLDAADAILTPDFVWHAPPQTVFLVGPDAIKQQAQELRAFFPDLVLADDDEIAEGDRVVIRWTLTGTAQTETGGVPVVYTGIDIFRIADGKLAELWLSTDAYGLAQQLGEIPVEATPAATPPTT